MKCSLVFTQHELDCYQASQHFPKTKLQQTKVKVTVWWPAAGVIQYSFLSPSETITVVKDCQQINETQQELQRIVPDTGHQKWANSSLWWCSPPSRRTTTEVRHTHQTFRQLIDTFSNISNFLYKKCIKNQNDSYSSISPI